MPPGICCLHQGPVFLLSSLDFTCQPQFYTVEHPLPSLSSPSSEILVIADNLYNFSFHFLSSPVFGPHLSIIHILVYIQGYDGILKGSSKYFYFALSSASGTFRYSTCLCWMNEWMNEQMSLSDDAESCNPFCCWDCTSLLVFALRWVRGSELTWL